MKKIIFIIITIFAFLLMVYNISEQEREFSFKSESGNEYREQYNNEKNLNIARKIAVLCDAEKVAVVGDKQNVIVGIMLKNKSKDIKVMKKQAEKITRESYKFAKIRVEIETEKTDRIMEIAENIKIGIPDKILINKMKNLIDF